MTDAEKREKVIHGLECCLSPNDHENCPYDGIGKTYSHCLKQLVTDALALLKADDETIKHLRILLNIAHNSNHQKRDINLERGIMEDIRNG